MRKIQKIIQLTNQIQMHFNQNCRKTQNKKKWNRYRLTTISKKRTPRAQTFLKQCRFRKLCLAGIYLFKATTEKIKTRCEFCSKTF